LDGNIALILLLVVSVIGLLEMFVHIHQHIKILGAVLVIVVITGYILGVWT